MSTALATLSTQLASKFDMGDGRDVSDILKATAFKSSTQVSDAQMTALLVVANQYGLNPFTREIFAFPDKGGIVPVVGVDGWSRIMNDHPQFDGMEFKQDAESCTCIIYRKDRSHSISATEYLSECKRDTSPAWKSHPKRMLRHKAMIQAARLAFGFGGIYDQDEAERIVEVTGDDKTINSNARVVEETIYLPAEVFEAQRAGWEKAITGGKKSIPDLVAWIEAKGTKLTEAQLKVITNWKKSEPTKVEPEAKSEAIDPDDIPFEN